MSAFIQRKRCADYSGNEDCADTVKVFNVYELETAEIQSKHHDQHSITCRRKLKRQQKKYTTNKEERRRRRKTQKKPQVYITRPDWVGEWDVCLWINLGCCQELSIRGLRKLCHVVSTLKSETERLQINPNTNLASQLWNHLGWKHFGRYLKKKKTY